MQVDLRQQVALVTGAAGGIGQSIADSLAANGAHVVYADINHHGAEQSANSVAQRQALAPGASNRCVGMHMDVTNESQVDAVIAATLEQFGQLDILVNNAGVNTLAHRVNIDQFPSDEWHRIVNVDLNGLFYVSRAATKVMLPRKSGRVINIASVMGLVPARLQCAFVAAKAGVVNLTKAMAIELGSQGILVNCIAPGSILTEGTRALFYGSSGKFNDRVQAMLAHVPLGRPGTCQEVAHTALFLAAPESSYINGAILTVDGGWLAGYSRDF